MAVPTAPDWTAGEDITEAKLDSVSTVLNYLLAPPRCYAYKTANGALTSGVWGDLSLTGESYDSHAAHDNSTNNTRLVAPEAGLYSIIAHGTFDTNSSGLRGLDIRKNAAGVQTGGTDLVLLLVNAHGTSETRIAVTVDAQLSASDYIEVFAYQNSGGPLNILGGAPALSFLSFRWVAKTV